MFFRVSYFFFTRRFFKIFFFVFFLTFFFVFSCFPSDSVAAGSSSLS